MAMPYCTICHNVYIQSEDIVSTRCGHVYHNDCLSEWLNTSKSCPQCRNNCCQDQMSRIYIDFVCDDDIACAQISRNAQTSCSLDSEETIKALLDFIDGGGKGTDGRDRECESCETNIKALIKLLAEKDELTSTLTEKEEEIAMLAIENKDYLQRNEAIDERLRQLAQELESTEQHLATFQAENLSKQDNINTLEAISQSYDDDIRRMHQQVKDLTTKMAKTLIDHRNELVRIQETIQHAINFNWLRCLRKIYRLKPTQMNSPPINNDKFSKALVPYCGNIDEWDYMLIPILKVSKKHLR